MDPDAAGMAVEQLFCSLDQRLPVAIQHFGIDEILQFEIALVVEQPVAVQVEIRQASWRRQ